MAHLTSILITYIIRSNSRASVKGHFTAKISIFFVALIFYQNYSTDLSNKGSNFTVKIKQRH